ncbi:DUF5682 family protein [Quadrisphaera setariae]|uniref:DUF5682 family protein n=1 Tax=Quadrisphaera setariae TaxID=2593304 RepID=UPI002106ECEC|nr:DUF5682 family protein [Quadrisphaera setariae]
MTSPSSATGPDVRVLGVRHHGPGSARSVRAELEAFCPDVVLVEGPADADPLVPLITGEGTQPPLALMAHVVDEPRRSVFWPFAVFSPEWQALDWATSAGVPVRFCDLPAALLLAPPAGEAAEEAGPEEQDDSAAEEEVPPVRTDPLAVLARAAGYDDPERWWDDVVESRTEGSPFPAVAEAMAALREEAPPAASVAEALHERRREAHMRTVLRRALKEGHQRVAVVCGAWHAPALGAGGARLGPASADAELLRGMPKARVALTWVPWTHGRLAASSGYGAGVVSPGWYHHLFTAPDRPVTRWLAAVAGVLREEDLPVSSASVIEAVRLAESLAVLRGRPLAGLEEVTEATRAALVDGQDHLLDLVVRRLVVGEALGVAPPDAPTTPLEADLRRTARSLRLKPDAAEKVLVLDLRTPNDLARSRLLHRLQLLGAPWGRPARGEGRSLGTFKEAWSLAWRPELAVELVEASVWGTAVEPAAVGRAEELAGEPSATLPVLTSLVETCLLADLSGALPRVLAALDARAAADGDVAHLLAALPPLVRALRYGDVRGTAAPQLGAVADALTVRACAGLAAAVRGVDDDAAGALRDLLDGFDAALRLRAGSSGGGSGGGDGGGADGVRRWTATARSLAARTDVHGLLTGRLARLLLDAGDLDADQVGARLSLALTPGTPPGEGARWVEGFLSGGGAVLAHDEALLALVDSWLSRLDTSAFLDVLPLLRRTFGSFSPTERRDVGRRVRRGPHAEAAGAEEPVDTALADPVLDTVLLLLGATR